MPLKRIDKSIYMIDDKPDLAEPLILKFHYSKRMPSLNRKCYLVRKSGGGFFGFDGEILAACIIGVPKARWKEQDFLELTRLVRIPTFKFQLTQLIAFACNDLKTEGHHLIISYADKIQNHHGGIYQAAGWNYHGERTPLVDGFYINSKYFPTRTCYDLWETCSLKNLQKLMPGRKIEPHVDEGKHLYWRALTQHGYVKAVRLGLKQTEYPKPNAGSPSDERSHRAS